ncbi:MAG: DUF4340 domain-containing protein [Clostridia bacterium]|nr:DUF4340 domain-containing protein [Clostridia bacterium]
MTKRIIITVVCAVLCIGLGVALVFLIPEESGTQSGGKIPYEEIVPTVAFADVSRIHIKNQKDEYTLINKDGGLVIEGAEHAPLNNYKLMYLLSNVCQTYKTYSADVSESELEKYGLGEGKHQAEFTVETLDGASYTIYIGDETLANDGYYVRVPGQNSVYVIGYSIEQDLLGTSEYLMDKNLIYPTDANFYFLVSDFVLQKGGEDFIKINFASADERSEFLAIGLHTLSYPEGYFASEHYTSILSKFTLLDAEGTTNFMVSEVYSYSADEAMLEEYGINPLSPAFMLSFSSPIMDNDGNPVAKIPNALLISEKMRDESGAYYYNVYSLLNGILGRVEAITLDFLEWGFDKWVSPYIFQANIMSVESISFDSKNGFYDFRLEGDANENLTVRETKSGYSPAIDNFRNLWRTMLALVHDGYCDLSDEELSGVLANGKNHLLTMKVKTRAGEVREYQFWQYTDQRVYYTVNGSGEFYIPITMVNKLIADVDRFMAGELIDPEARY